MKTESVLSDHAVLSEDLQAAMANTDGDRPLDEFHAHEACDRAALFCNVIGCELLEHPYVQANPRIERKISRALSLLAAAYQMIGRKRFADFSRPKAPGRAAGGRARAEKLTAERRTAIAKKAAAARWAGPVVGPTLAKSGVHE